MKTPLQQATVLFLIRDDQILLAMKKRGFGEGKWNGAGGKPEGDETIEETARRECEEEIKVTPGDMQQAATLNFAFVDKPDWNQCVHVYLCREWSGVPEETDEMRPQWYAIKDIPYEAMWADDKVWLPAILAGNFVKGDFVFKGEEMLRHSITTNPLEKFLFRAPERLKNASNTAHAVLQLAAFSGQLALEDRSNVTHTNGRAENVAEHSLMLAVIAPIISEQLYPKLDPNLVTRFATIHDAVEAYVGDTPTLRIDTNMLQKKYAREKQGLAQLLQDYSWLPSFTKTIQDYEAQQVPEARFVRVLDKIMPVAIHFNEGGSVLTGHSTAKDLKQRAILKEQAFREEYPEFEELISIRTELIDLAITHLYTNS